MSRQTMQFCSAFITFTLNFMTEITNFTSFLTEVTLSSYIFILWLNDEMTFEKRLKYSLIITIEI